MANRHQEKQGAIEASENSGEHEILASTHNKVEKALDNKRGKEMEKILIDVLKNNPGGSKCISNATAEKMPEILEQIVDNSIYAFEAHDEYLGVGDSADGGLNMSKKTWWALADRIPEVKDFLLSLDKEEDKYHEGFFKWISSRKQDYIIEPPHTSSHAPEKRNEQW